MSERGYRPIGDYAAIGNQRAIALVARDGSIDFLCSPRFDGPTIFGALLDAEGGGRFALEAVGTTGSDRRYLSGTNVLETVHRTETGVVRVVDAMPVQTSGRLPLNEVTRRVEGVEGEVEVRWSIEPRPAYGARRVVRRDAGPPEAVVVGEGDHHLVVQSFGLGEPAVDGGSVRGGATVRAGERHLLAVELLHAEPLLAPTRGAIESRVQQTCDRWRSWCEGIHYDGPWRELVERSALALDLLVYQSTGAMIAAGTLGLPESLEGGRDYDYRYAWLRDTTFTLDAMARIGHDDQVHATLTWLLRTVEQDLPELRPFYRIDGSRVPADEREVPLAGWRGAGPVVVGNGAADQLQLGAYGDLFATAARYVQRGHALDPATAEKLAAAADHVCEHWQHRDSGIWELGEERHYTSSKIGCWVALDRAGRLAGQGQLAGDAAGRWRREAERIRSWTLERCWSASLDALARDADHHDELDAAVLLAARFGFLAGDDPRLARTADAVREHLGRGPLLYRYTGMAGKEGCFLACSFWLVEALVHCGRVDEAREVFAGAAALANDVGLLSEEADPDSGELLGNFPQALTHLALVNAAIDLTAAIDPGERPGGQGVP